MSNRQCEKCNAENIPNARFCVECGAVLNDGNTSEQSANIANIDNAKSVIKTGKGLKKAHIKKFFFIIILPFLYVYKTLKKVNKKYYFASLAIFVISISAYYTFRKKITEGDTRIMQTKAEKVMREMDDILDSNSDINAIFPCYISYINIKKTEDVAYKELYESRNIRSAYFKYEYIYNFCVKESKLLTKTFALKNKAEKFYSGIVKELGSESDYADLKDKLKAINIYVTFKEHIKAQTQYQNILDSYKEEYERLIKKANTKTILVLQELHKANDSSIDLNNRLEYLNNAILMLTKLKLTYNIYLSHVKLKEIEAKIEFRKFDLEMLQIVSELDKVKDNTLQYTYPKRIVFLKNANSIISKMKPAFGKTFAQKQQKTINDLYSDIETIESDLIAKQVKLEINQIADILKKAKDSNGKMIDRFILLENVKSKLAKTISTFNDKFSSEAHKKINYLSSEIKDLDKELSILNDKTLPILNPDFGKNFIYVKAGSFKRKVGKQIIDVILKKNFWIGKYEVTQKEYKLIMKYNPSRFKFKDGNHPVERITWKDAVDFCKKLTKLDREAKRIPLNYEYRLPTYAEWRYSAQGGNKSKGYEYSGSDSIDEVAWYLSNSEKQSHPVGEKKPNELGIYDMSGNVKELCLSYSKYRDIAGGAFCDVSTVCRGLYSFSKSLDSIGFRLVCCPESF